MLLFRKNLNFDLLTLSSGEKFEFRPIDPILRVGGGGGGGGGGGRRGGGTRGGSQQFFRHITASHTLLGKLS